MKVVLEEVKGDGVFTEMGLPHHNTSANIRRHGPLEQDTTIMSFSKHEGIVDPLRTGAKIGIGGCTPPVRRHKEGRADRIFQKCQSDLTLLIENITLESLPRSREEQEIRIRITQRKLIGRMPILKGHSDILNWNCLDLFQQILQLSSLQFFL